MTARKTWPAVSAALLGGLAAVVVAQQDMSKVEIKTEKLADNVWVLYGSGGNIGLCSGPDGALLIDDEFAPLSAKILAAAKAANDAPLRWVVNTHWHGDHTGGNEAMATSSSGSRRRTWCTWETRISAPPTPSSISRAAAASTG